MPEAALVVATAGAPPAAGWDCHVHIFDRRLAVLPGHYQPETAALHAIEKLANSHGFGHVVLVQPSVYGFDNRLLCDALAASEGRHRGVVVVNASIPPSALESMHTIGVRGVRFNCVSPAGWSQPGCGVTDAIVHAFKTLEPVLHALGWHVQWYAHADDLPAIAALHSNSSVPAVLDHLAGLQGIHAHLPASHPVWTALARLVGSGTWLKLSGWYRLHATFPYAMLDASLIRAAALFGPRLVWGSDWPHTFFQPPEQLPEYAGLWAPVERCLDAAQFKRVKVEGPWALYR